MNWSRDPGYQGFIVIVKFCPSRPVNEMHPLTAPHTHQPACISPTALASAPPRPASGWRSSLGGRWEPCCCHIPSLSANIQRGRERRKEKSDSAILFYFIHSRLRIATADVRSDSQKRMTIYFVRGSYAGEMNHKFIWSAILTASWFVKFPLLTHTRKHTNICNPERPAFPS